MNTKIRKKYKKVWNKIRQFLNVKSSGTLECHINGGGVGWGWGGGS